jgi:hypothetical protein
MASWRPPLLQALLALAVAGLGCKQAGGEHQLVSAAGGTEAVGSSLSNAPPPPSASASASASANEEQEHDCRSHSPQRHAPLAPPAKKLSPRDRARVTSVQVLAHGSAVIVRKQADGWVMGGPSGCAVSSQRVQRALDNLSSLKVVTNGAPPPQDDRQIILLGDSDVLLQYDVGVGAGGADPARLPDGSVVQLHGLHRGLLSSQPDDWCLASER